MGGAVSDGRRCERWEEVGEMGGGVRDGRRWEIGMRLVTMEEVVNIGIGEKQGRRK